jgi:hypothetical protein
MLQGAVMDQLPILQKAYLTVPSTAACKNWHERILITAIKVDE